jgi:predicted RNase H-like HicB family nuclease
VTYRTRQRTRQKQRHHDKPSPLPEEQLVENAPDRPDVPYPITLVQDADEGDWVATVDALAGCTARGATPQEALDAVSGRLVEFMEAAAREGREVPDPKSLQSHSGRLLLRMPQTLHAELSRVAERESVSLNQFITDILAGALGWRVPVSAGRIATRSVQAGGLNGDGDGQLGADPDLSAVPQRRATPVLTAALVVNLVVVAVAAAVAIIVLIAAWM